MKKLLIMLGVFLLLSGRAEALDISRFRQLPSCVLAEDLSSIEDLERKGWTVAGNPTIAETPYGKAIDFDGTGDYLTALDTVDISSAGSISMWVYFDSTSSANSKLIQLGSASGNRVQIYKSSVAGRLDSQVDGSGTDGSPNFSDYPFNSWNHIVLTWGSNAHLYVNSGIGASSTGIDLPANTQALISIAHFGGASSPIAKIKNLLIFNRVLSAEEISDIYYNTTFDYNQDLVSHWDLSEVNPQDIGWKGNGNDGTGTGLVASTDLVFEDGDWGVEFNGSDEIVALASDPISDPMSIFAKVKVTNEDSDDIISAQGSAGDRGWGFSTDGSGKITFFTSDDGTNLGEIKSSTAPLEEGIIYSVGVTYSGTTAILYTDGSVLTDDSGTVYANSRGSTNGTRIGGRNSGAELWDGRIYDMKIYSAALTYMQVQDIFIREGR